MPSMTRARTSTARWPKAIWFYLNDGRIDAVVGYNRPRDVRRLLPIIKARQTVDPDVLRNEDVDLRSLQR